MLCSVNLCVRGEKTQTPTWVLKNDAYSYLINYTSICNRREDLSLGKRRGECAGEGGGLASRGLLGEEGRALFKAQMTVLLQEPRTSPCAQRRAR